MKKLAIIGAGKMAVSMAVAAKKLGVETHCFGTRVGSSAMSIVDYFYDVDVFDAESIIGICRKAQIDGVAAATDLGLVTAARAAAALGLVGNAPEDAERYTDKYQARLLTQSVPAMKQPRFFPVAQPEDLALADLACPVILKPRTGSGKMGVCVLASPSDAEACFQYAEQDCGKGVKLLAEERLPGDHVFSAETLSWQGEHYLIQVTLEKTSGPPHFVEISLEEPAANTPEMREKIRQALFPALTAIGVRNGPCHTEFKLIDNEVWLIEYNVRPAGWPIADRMIRLSTGYSYLRGVIEIALGRFCPQSAQRLENRFAGACDIPDSNRALSAVFRRCARYAWCDQRYVAPPSDGAETTHTSCELSYVICRADEPTNLRSLMATEPERQKRDGQTVMILGDPGTERGIVMRLREEGKTLISCGAVDAGWADRAYGARPEDAEDGLRFLALVENPDEILTFDPVWETACRSLRAALGLDGMSGEKDSGEESI